MLHLNGHIKISHARFSSPGIKAENEDATGLFIPEDAQQLITKGIAAVIADGVSSAEVGKEASESCVKKFIEEYYLTPDTWTTSSSAEQVLTGINRALFRKGKWMPQAERGYVTTLSALVLKSRTAHIFHIGDTRVYLIRNGELRQLTTDHHVRVSDDNVYLSRAIGLDVSARIDYVREQTEEGDVFLLTTDGVHDFVDEKLFVESFPAKAGSGDAKCRRIVRKAMERGSKDNLSCMVIHVKEIPAQTADDLNDALTELPFPPPLNMGQKLDGYEVLEEVHASTRSQLYLVRDEATGTQMIMKTPSINFEDDPAYIERFVMESWIGRRLDHPNVVKILEPSRRPSCLYYLTEYIDGTTLSEWMEAHHPCSMDEFIPMADQLISGLRAFQRKEMLHQDLKPGNIMVDAAGRVVIIDFGSCFVHGIEELSAPIERDLILGTADYAAPEYHLGLKADIRSDLFSLGCIFYEMLTGSHPYGVVYSRCKTEADFGRLEYLNAYRKNSDIPLWLDGAIKKSVQIRQMERYSALSEFFEDLKRPNRKFLREYRQPLIERNPLGFWKGLSFILIGVIIILLIIMLQP